MSPFVSFVSRKVIGAVAIFAVVTIGLVGFAVAWTAASPSDASDNTAQFVEPQAFEAALDDPESIDNAVAGDQRDAWNELRADLRAVRGLDGEARRDALADIRAKARDGGYGAEVERRADRRQVRHELVFDLLPENLQADLTALKDAPAEQRPDLVADIREGALAGEYGPEVQEAAEKLRDLRRD